MASWLFASTTVVIMTLEVLVRADLPVTEVMKAQGHGGSEPYISYWTPSLISTKAHTTLLFAQADTAAARAGKGPFGYQMSTSHDAGQSWSAPVLATNFVIATPQVVYSRTTDTLFMLAVDEEKNSRATTQTTKNSLTAAPAPPPFDPPSPIWATDLPKPPAGEIRGCHALISNSTDHGNTWSTPVKAQVNGTMESDYFGGAGLGHGIELRRGKYAGRLAIARRYGCKTMWGHSQQYVHSFVLYSDDQGEHWNAGELLPQGWTECQVAELINGSLLMTSRMAGPPYLSKAHPASDHRRGFARSDDGGQTWAEIWYLEDRQPEVLVGTNDESLVSDVEVSDNPTGILYFGHPGAADFTNLPMMNYTVHRSLNGGATWEFVKVIYSGGAGYSDMHVLAKPDGGLALGIAFQKTFSPPDPHIEGGGYNMGFARLDLSGEAMTENFLV